MPNEDFSFHSSETHEQFLQRASDVFPTEWAENWSRIERAVFNQLMSRLIHQCPYNSITEAMLHQCRDDMANIVSRCGHG